VINAVTACQLLKFVDFDNVVGEPGPRRQKEPEMKLKTVFLRRQSLLPACLLRQPPIPSARVDLMAVRP
jgi:hypothetical protein